MPVTLSPTPAASPAPNHAAIVVPTPPLRQSLSTTDALAAFAILAGAAVVMLGIARRRSTAALASGQAAGLVLEYQEKLAHANARIAELEQGITPQPRTEWSGMEIKPAGPQHDRRDRLRSEVYALADQGWTSLRIAQRTGKQPAEIDLILNLRKARARSA